MPLSAPLEDLNVYVDFFGQSPSAESPGNSTGTQQSAASLLSPRGAHRPNVPPADYCQVGEARTCTWSEECLPSLFVLTHAHTDHLRGLIPSWAKGSNGTQVTIREPRWSSRGPIVCTEITGQLLIRRFPQLRPLVLPLKLQTPYLFLIR